MRQIRLHIILMLGIVSGLLSNVIATWADQQWGLSKADRIGITLTVFIVVIFFSVLLEAGAPIPGLFAFHRFWYLYGLTRSPLLNHWTKDFAPLHLGYARRYIPSAEVLDGDERHDLVELLLNTIASPTGAERHILILGEPGCGKSTALERLTLELARRARFPSLGLRGPIPVLIRSGDKRSADDLESMVAGALSQWTLGTTRNVLTAPRAVQRLLDSPRLVILFDALDEYSGQRRADVLSALASPARAAGLAHLSVVITCRTRQDPENALSDFKTFSILDLSDDAVDTFITTYSGGVKDETQARLAIGGFLAAGGLGRNPFWLEGLIKVDAKERTKSGILAAMSRRALSEELDKPLGVERSWNRVVNISKDQHIEECQRALAHLSLEIDLGRNLPRDSVRAMLMAWLTKRARELGVQALAPDHILELARDAHLLDGALEVVAFRHRILQEFFAARGLYNDATAIQKRLLTYIGDPDRWQMLSMYAGMLSPNQRDAFVRAILANDWSPTGLACAITTYVGDNQLVADPMIAELHKALRKNLVSGDDIDPQLVRSLRQFLTTGYDLAADFLGRLLADPEPRVRSRAYRLLGLSEAPEALRLLAFIGLDDRNASVGQMAVATLAGMGQRAVWPLVRQLFSERGWVRERAVQALAELEAPQAINYLLRCAGPDEVIGAALSRCGSRRVGRLLVALATGDAAERRRAIIALESNRDPRVFEALKAAIWNSDASVRDRAIAALEKRSDHNEVIALLVKALDDEDSRVRLMAARELERREEGAVGAHARRRIEQVFKEQTWAGVSSEAQTVKYEIPRSSSMFTDLAPWPSVERLAVRPAGPAVAAVQALAERNDEAATHALLDRLEDDDEDIRRTAARYLADGTAPGRREALIARLPTLLNSPLVAARLGAIAALVSVIEADVQHTLDGPFLADCLLRTLDDADPAICAAAADALIIVPAAWLAFRLAPRPSNLPASIQSVVLRLVARCGEPGATPLITTAMFQQEPHVQLAAARAAGILGDLSALPALLTMLRVNGAAAPLQEMAKDALALMGPVAWPQLRPLLAGRNVPAPLLAAAAEALGESNDLDLFTTGRLLALLSHASPKVRASAAAGLRHMGDLAASALATPLASVSPDARMYAQVLLALLEGKSLPQSADLALQSFRTALDERDDAEDQSSMAVAPIENSFEFVEASRPHVRELVDRVGLVGGVVFTAGIAGALLYKQIALFLARVVYGVPASDVAAYLPASPYSAQVIVLIIAAWIGMPVFIYQGWKFSTDGLTSREKRLAQPVLISMGLILFITPLIAAIIIRLLSLIAARLALIIIDNETLIWITNRLTIATLITIFWIVGFSPIWRWVNSQARAAYVLRLASGGLVLRPNAFSDIFRRRLLLVALTSSVTIALLPTYLISSLLLGFIIDLLILAIFLWQLVSENGFSFPSRKKLLFQASLLRGLYSPEFFLCWPLLIILSLLFRSSATQTLCGLLYGAPSSPDSGLCVTDNAVSLWFVFVFSVWAGLACASAIKFVFDCIISRKGDSVLLGRLSAFALIVAPLFLSGLYWRWFGKIGLDLGWSPAITSWLTARLAATTTALVVGGICLWALRGLQGKITLRIAVIAALFVLALGFAPATVLAGAAAWPVAVFILFMPVVADLILTRGLRGSAEAFRNQYRPRDYTTELLSESLRGWLEKLQ